MVKIIKFCIVGMIILLQIISCDEKREISKSIKKSKKNEDSLSLKLLGKWGGLDELTPVFYIRKDSIYYFQHLKAYPYKINDKNLEIKFENSTGVLKSIDVNVDTMSFTDDVGLIIRAYRLN